MFRIYFDTNAGDQLHRYSLGIPGSLEDIEPINDLLKIGMHVTLYDYDELEVEAVLDFNEEYGRWMASPIWSTLQRVSRPVQHAINVRGIVPHHEAPACRIYFDQNLRDEIRRYRLGAPRSLDDISSITANLRTGLHVALYDYEREVEAVLDFVEEDGEWVASPIWSTLKHFNVS